MGSPRRSGLPTSCVVKKSPWRRRWSILHPAAASDHVVHADQARAHQPVGGRLRHIVASAIDAEGINAGSGVELIDEADRCVAEALAIRAHQEDVLNDADIAIRAIQ